MSLNDASLSRRSLIVRGALGAAAMTSLPTLLSACGDGGGSSGPSRGGQLRMGFSGATTADTLDPHHPLTDFAYAMVTQQHAGLLRYRDDGSTNLALAEEFTIESPTSVVVRLRQGLEFHNGKTITADDILASIARISDPANPGPGAATLSEVDLDASKKLDERTVRLALAAPNVFIEDIFTLIYSAVLPDGAWDPENPVGAGPFKLVNFDPGNSVEFERFENFWDGAPLIDSLILQNFAEPTALVNSLSSGVIDIAGKIPTSLAKTLDSKFTVVTGDSGQFTPYVMPADTKPFDDVRVRQAFRLLVDRPGLLDQLQDGQGLLGNDLYSPFDPAFDGSIAQREQDIDQAKSLLKAAGVDGLKLSMATSGFVANGEVALAEQARAAGVTIDVKQVDQTTFYAQHYGTDPLWMTLWTHVPYMLQTEASVIPGAAYPECRWANEEFLALRADAKKDPDETTRLEKLHEMQRIFHEEGPYLIWGFSAQTDAMAPNVTGNRTDRSGYPFAWFDFTKMSVK